MEGRRNRRSKLCQVLHTQVHKFPLYDTPAYSPAHSSTDATIAEFAEFNVQKPTCVSANVVAVRRCARVLFTSVPYLIRGEPLASVYM